MRNNSQALSEFDCCYLVLRYRRFLKANFNVQFDDQLEFYNVTVQMRSVSNFKNMPVVLHLKRVDASKFKVLTFSTFEYVSKANKSKETCIPTNESQIKAAVCRFSE